MRRRNWIPMLAALATLAMGCSGSDGARGAAGPEGPGGPQGEPGKVGLPGPQGPAGPKGPTGDSGKPADPAEALHPWIESLEPTSISAHTIFTIRGENFAPKATKVLVGEQEATILSISKTEIRARVEPRVQCLYGNSCLQSVSVVSRGLTGNSFPVVVVPRGHVEEIRVPALTGYNYVTSSVLQVDEEGAETLVLGVFQVEFEETERILLLDPKGGSLRLGGDWVGHRVTQSADGRLFGVVPGLGYGGLLTEIDTTGTPVSREQALITDDVWSISTPVMDDEGRVFFREDGDIIRFEDGSGTAIVSTGGTGLAIGGGHLYWNDSLGGIFRVEVDADPVVPEEVVAIPDGTTLHFRGPLTYQDGLLYTLRIHDVSNEPDFDIISVDVETGEVETLVDLSGWDFPSNAAHNIVGLHPSADGGFYLVGPDFVARVDEAGSEFLAAPIFGGAMLLGDRIFATSYASNGMLFELGAEEVRPVLSNFFVESIAPAGKDKIYALGYGMVGFLTELRLVDTATGAWETVPLPGNGFPIGIASDPVENRLYFRQVTITGPMGGEVSLGWMPFGGNTVTWLKDGEPVNDMSMGLAFHEGRLYYPILFGGGMGIEVSPVADFNDRTCVGCGMLEWIAYFSVAPDGALIIVDDDDVVYDWSAESGFIYTGVEPDAGAVCADDGRLLFFEDGKLFWLYR